ncbi:MAG: GNAT family N-acetyltransferase, partial [Clostridia bacterium]|nr:GNAT family N-acetyltransferase [Clostridia bacterium]
MFDKIKDPTLKDGDLTVEKIEEKDKKDYFSLYVDDELNKFWGYDYREDLKGEPTENYFYDFQNSLKEKKEEYSFSVKVNGTFIGETVLHNFTTTTVEVGIRLFEKYQKKGYAKRTVLLMEKYVKNVLKKEKITAKY